MSDHMEPGHPGHTEEMTLKSHEHASQTRYEKLCKKLKSLKEHKMSDTTKVENIFARDPMAGIAPLLMGRDHGGGGLLAGGFGAGLVGGLLGGVLFGGRGRGGLFGGGDDCGNGGAETRIEDTIFNTQVLAKLGTLEGAIPLAAVNTENVILQQTNQITQLAAAAQLANQAGFANVKDTVQNTTALILAQGQAIDRDVLTEACSIKSTIFNDGEKTRALLSARFSLEDQTRITTLANEVTELREESRRAADEARRVTDVNALRSSIEINNSATATQAQAQGQFQVQSQFQAINNALGQIIPVINGLVQVAHATAANTSIIAGNSGAVLGGAQTATPTSVNTASRS